MDTYGFPLIFNYLKEGTSYIGTGSVQCEHTNCVVALKFTSVTVSLTLIINQSQNLAGLESGNSEKDRLGNKLLLNLISFTKESF